MGEAFLSSPDPLNDLSPFAAQLGSHQATPSQSVSRLLDSSPNKRMFRIDVGSASHPQKIKVTVETEQLDQENVNDPHQGRLPRVSSTRQPFNVRHNERTITTTIPLKGFSDYKSQPPICKQTSKRVQGRPSTPKNTPAFSNNSASVDCSSRNFERGRRIPGDLVDGDDAEDFDFSLARSLELGRGNRRSRSQSNKTSVRRDVEESYDNILNQSTSRHPTPTRRTSTRITSTMFDTARIPTEQSCSDGLLEGLWTDDAGIDGPFKERPISTLRTARPSSLYETSGSGGPGREAIEEDSFDTILDSEGFSMISIESVPSLQDHLSSPEVQPRTAATPRSVGHTRLLERTKLHASMRNGAVAASEREDVARCTSAAKEHNNSVAGFTCAVQNVDRLLTPEETPSPGKTTVITYGDEQLGKSWSSSKHEVSKNSLGSIRSSPPSITKTLTAPAAHVRHKSSVMTRNTATPSEKSSSPKPPPIRHNLCPSQSEPALCRASQNLSPIVRAGRELQDALVSSSTRERSQTLDSPFESPQPQKLKRNNSIAVLEFSPYPPKNSGMRRKGYTPSTVPGRAGTGPYHDICTIRSPKDTHDIQGPTYSESISTLARDDDPFESTNGDSAHFYQEVYDAGRADYSLQLPDSIRTTHPPKSQFEAVMSTEHDKIGSYDRAASKTFNAVSSSENASPLDAAHDRDMSQSLSIKGQPESSSKLLRDIQYREQSPTIRAQIEVADSIAASPMQINHEFVVNMNDGCCLDEDIWLEEAKNSSSILSEQPMADLTKTVQKGRAVSPQLDNVVNIESLDEENEQTWKTHTSPDFHKNNPTSHLAPHQSNSLSSRANLSDFENTVSSVGTQNRFAMASLGKTGVRTDLNLSQLLGSSPAKVATLEDQTIDPSTLNFVSPINRHDTITSGSLRIATPSQAANDAVVHWPDLLKQPTTVSSSKDTDRQAPLPNECARKCLESAISSDQQQAEPVTLIDEDEDIVSDDESFCSSQLETSTPYRQQPPLSPSLRKSCLRVARLGQPSPSKSVIFIGLSSSMSGSGSMTPTQSDVNSTQSALAGDSLYPEGGREKTAAATSNIEGHKRMQSAISKPSLSKTEWSLDHWKLLQRIWLDAEACPHKSTPAECTSSLLGQSFVSTARGGRLLPLEPWHIDVIRWFREEVNGCIQPASDGTVDEGVSVIAEGWTEHDIALRVYGLIVGRERREARAKGEEPRGEELKKKGAEPTGIWNILVKNFGW